MTDSLRVWWRQGRTRPETIGGQVNDSLRDRIAAALRERVACGHHETYEDVADAVIAELGLKHYCRECGGWGPFDD